MASQGMRLLKPSSFGLLVVIAWGMMALEAAADPGGLGSSGVATITHYTGIDAGACGYGNLQAAGLNQYIAAASDVYWNNGMNCGACYELQCASTPGWASCNNGGKVVVRLTDQCPGNANTQWCSGDKMHFDLSEVAFMQLTQLQSGFASVKYTRVMCPSGHGVSIQMKPGVNENWIEVWAMGIGMSGSVTRMWVKGTGTYCELKHNWGAHFTMYSNCGGVSMSSPLTFKIAEMSGEVREFPNCVGPGWSSGKMYTCSDNFNAGPSAGGGTNSLGTPPTPKASPPLTASPPPKASPPKPSPMPSTTLSPPPAPSTTAGSPMIIPVPQNGYQVIAWSKFVFIRAGEYKIYYKFQFTPVGGKLGKDCNPGAKSILKIAAPIGASCRYKVVKKDVSEFGKLAEFGDNKVYAFLVTKQKGCSFSGNIRYKMGGQPQAKPKAVRVKVAGVGSTPFWLFVPAYVPTC